MYLVIPYGHDRGVRRLPLLTFGLMAACVIVQLGLTVLPDRTGSMTSPLAQWAFVPLVARPITWISYAFLHGGVLHLLGNFLFLYLAGSTIEDRWGRPVFLAFYLLGAAAAAGSFWALHPNDEAVLIGASGAIAAAMGAFLVCFHDARIRLAYVVFMGRFRSGTFTLPAYWALPLWLLVQVLESILEANGWRSGVAYSAHVGGFAFGVLVAVVLRWTGLDERLDAAVGRASGATLFDEPPELTRARERAAVGDRTGQRRALEALARRDPDDETAVVELCRVALAAHDVGAMHGRLVRALQACERSHAPADGVELWLDALRVAPDQPPPDRAYPIAARLFERVDRCDDAVQTLQALVRDHPQSPIVPRAFLEAARLLTSRLRDVAAARTVLEVLLARQPDGPIAAEARRRLAAL